MEHLGYTLIRQKSSHVRLRHEGPSTITVLLHNPLKTGIPDGIHSEVAQVRSVTLESLAQSF